MYDSATVLGLVKTRLDRLQTDTSLDSFLTARIAAAEKELNGKGITIGSNADDLMLLVDYTVFQYSARDNAGGMPDWLRLRIRERWLREGRDDGDT